MFKNLQLSLKLVTILNEKKFDVLNEKKFSTVAKQT